MSNQQGQPQPGMVERAKETIADSAQAAKDKLTAAKDTVCKQIRKSIINFQVVDSAAAAKDKVADSLTAAKDKTVRVRKIP